MIGVINQNEKVSCRDCGWEGKLGEAICAMWIDPMYRTPVNAGGDGYNFRCPRCKNKVKVIRYDPPKMRTK
jgi:predicted RNA-binding Zn-ribbon protein involved in translation (DUF1610 family)